MTARRDHQAARGDPRRRPTLSAGSRASTPSIVVIIVIWLLPTLGMLVNSFRPASDVAAVRLVDGPVADREVHDSTTTQHVLSQNEHRPGVRQQPVHHDPGDDHPGR